MPLASRDRRRRLELPNGRLAVDPPARGWHQGPVSFREGRSLTARAAKKADASARHASAATERFPDGGRYAEIVSHAAKLFADSGFAGASMQDLASAVGITKASLYHFFKDKEEIHSTVVLIALEGLNRLVDERVAEQTSAVDRVDAFCRAHADYLASNADFYVAAAIGYKSITDPQARRNARSLRTGYEQKLRDIIAAGIEAGEFRELDAQLGARAIISCLNWMARWWRPGGPRSADEIASAYAGLIIRGFLPGK